MRILITNNSLHKLGGAESFVRDLACDLQSFGHTAMVYSTDLRQVVHLASGDLFHVVEDIHQLPAPPDIIHAQHHLDAMTALTAWPGVPAIYHCHGAVWRESIPKHPRIYHYLAMSRTMRERLMIEFNIPPYSIDVFLNGYDPRRFSAIRQLPEQPKRGLFYNKIHARQSPTAQAVKSAAVANGIEMDWIGSQLDRMIDAPENILPNYDIVFASGRSAIEALASGCAVIVLGRTSCGEMVTPENFDRFREVNFSIAVNSPPPSTEEISRQLRRFSASECHLVTNRIRTEADSRATVGTLERLYQQVIEVHETRIIDEREELLALSHYMRRLVPLVKMTDECEMQNNMPGSRANLVQNLVIQMTLVKQSLAMSQRSPY